MRQNKKKRLLQQLETLDEQLFGAARLPQQGPHLRAHKLYNAARQLDGARLGSQPTQQLALLMSKATTAIHKYLEKTPQ